MIDAHGSVRGKALAARKEPEGFVQYAYVCTLFLLRSESYVTINLCSLLKGDAVMELQEWIGLGIQNGIIDTAPRQEVTFREVYERWFLMKLKVIKPQSCDRLECTYNRYYAGTGFSHTYVSQINERILSDFLTSVILGMGGVTLKEYRRIYQIANNVMVYAKDLKIGGARLLDWDVVKRYVPEGKFSVNSHKYFAVPRQDVERLLDCVLNRKIYPLKQSACLCLVLNFFLGLRVGELASLTWSDIDGSRNVVRISKTEIKTHSRDSSGRRCGSMVYQVVEDTKTFHSTREVPLLPAAHYILRELRAHHAQCGYQCGGDASRYLAFDGGTGILVRSLDRTLRRLCFLSGVNYFNTHAIRKTFATMLHASGMPTRYISDILGHSEMHTTERSYILGYEDNNAELLEYMSRGLDFTL